MLSFRFSSVILHSYSKQFPPSWKFAIIELELVKALSCIDDSIHPTFSKKWIIGSNIAFLKTVCVCLMILLSQIKYYAEIVLSPNRSKVFFN